MDLVCMCFGFSLSSRSAAKTCGYWGRWVILSVCRSLRILSPLEAARLLPVNSPHLQSVTGGGNSRGAGIICGLRWTDRQGSGRIVHHDVLALCSAIPIIGK